MFSSLFNFSKNCANAVKTNHDLAGLKIVFVFSWLEMGGAERQGMFLARYLKENCNAHVEVWGLGITGGRLMELCEEIGIACRSICFNPSGVVGWLSELASFSRLLRSERPDILLSYSAGPNVLCGITWRWSGVRLCIWNQRDEGRHLGRFLLHQIAICQTRHFISNSIEGKNFLAQTFAIDLKQIETVPNGVSIPKLSVGRPETRRQMGIGQGNFVACMVGNLHQFKDHTTLLRAWELVVGSIPKGEPIPILLLAGRFDGTQELLYNLAEEIRISEYVRFLGPIIDIISLLRSIDLYVHSSRFEGIPNSVLEAMSVGLPVAATDISGIREAVGPAGYEFLAPPRNPEALAQIILSLMKDREKRLALGKAMEMRAREEFNLERMCKRSADLFAKWLRNRR